MRQGEQVFMALTKSDLRFSLVCLLMLVLPATGSSEIYKWVDAKGQVHFSDKRNAHEQAKLVEGEAVAADPSGNEFLFQPEADVLLRQGSGNSLGNSSLLSVGNSTRGGSRVQEVSLLRFDISSLLAELHRNPTKKLLSASLLLYANTEENPHNQDAPGHMGGVTDTAFYLKPVHNNFDEKTITWDQFFNQNHYTPNAIRRLPGTAVPGTEDAQRNYDIDLMPLLTQLTAGNLRQFTLEMRLQRVAGNARVNIYSREASVEKRPTLRVLLTSSPAANP
jgi:hypothetical protein